MKDMYLESVVTRKTVPGAKAIKQGLGILALVALYISLFYNRFFLVIAIALGIAYYFAVQNIEVEFDYFLMDGELDIAKVASEWRRKPLLSVPISKLILIAPEDSTALSQYQHLKLEDFSDKEPDHEHWIVICNTDSKKRKIRMQLDGEMLLYLKKNIPHSFSE